MTLRTTKPTRRRRIWDKTDGRCAHCGRAVKGRNRTIDHFIPKSLGGTYDRRNLMPLCRICNHGRGSKPIEPEEYYIYAPEEAIQECIEYRDEFNGARRNMNGEIV